MDATTREFRSPREPVSVEQKITRIYRAAWREIKDSLFAIDPSSITPTKIFEIRKSVRTTVRALDYAASLWTSSAIPAQFKRETKIARIALEILGKKPKKKPAVDLSKIGADRALDFYIEANRSIIRSVDRYLSIVQMARAAIGRAQIQEFTFTEYDEAAWLKRQSELAVQAEWSKGSLKNAVRDHLEDLVADGNLIEINGKFWRMDKYADLVARTSLRDAATDATLNLCDQFDNDLVEISNHATDCDICAEFEGNVYSITGKTPGYPGIEEYPPFHPNCKHSILPTSIEAIDVRRSRND